MSMGEKVLGVLREGMKDIQKNERMIGLRKYNMIA